MGFEDEAEYLECLAEMAYAEMEWAQRADEAMAELIEQDFIKITQSTEPK